MDKLLLKKLLFNTAIICLISTSQLFAQKSFLERLKPDEANLQYAGSIGFISAGAGYHFFRDKTALSFHIGYVPETLGGELTIIAIKFDYKPFKLNLGDKLIIYPINPVIFPSYTLGENFDFKFERPQYRKGYYFWSSALRLHLGASSEIKMLTMPNSKVKSVSLYIEANTNDLYAISWFKNRTSTPFYEMFKLGYGVKLYF